MTKKHLELPISIIRIINVLEDDLDCIPEFQCNDCGSFDCDYEEHPELDGSPREKWCNKCSSDNLSLLREDHRLLLVDLKEAIAQDLHLAEQKAREEVEVFANEPFEKYGYVNYYECPKCSNTTQMKIEHKFCSQCGVKIKWLKDRTLQQNTKDKE